MSSRGLVFIAIALGCLLLGGGWVVISSKDASTTSTARVELASDGPSEAQSDPDAAVKLDGELLVRTVDPDDPRLNGRLARLAPGAGKPARDSGRLACQRVDMAAGAGLCLALAPSGVEYRALIFDRRYHVRHELALSGLPSRARVSPRGRWGAVTTFTSGDAYAAPGAFSTRTWVIDMRSGRRVADLERFTAMKDGKRLDSPDLNYWGVTFARDEDTFYATLSTGGRRYLVKGSLAERRVELLRTNVECPSLSPDGRHLAYKKRVGEVQEWRLHVLDLKTDRDVELAERRSIDDQAEWLNDETVVYGDGRSVWAVRADGGGRPQRLLARAASPAAARNG
jgi:dipeptidyl aminopeptidase/acylaminoacyl peptidase